MDVGAFGFLFSHDDTTTSSTDSQGRRDRRERQSDDDEAGPGRPLEMLFSGDGDGAPSRDT